MEMMFDKLLGRFIPRNKFEIRQLEKEKSEIEINQIVNTGWRSDRLKVVNEELNQLKETA